MLYMRTGQRERRPQFRQRLILRLSSEMKGPISIQIQFLCYAHLPMRLPGRQASTGAQRPIQPLVVPPSMAAESLIKPYRPSLRVRFDFAELPCPVLLFLV